MALQLFVWTFQNDFHIRKGEKDDKPINACLYAGEFLNKKTKENTVSQLMQANEGKKYPV